MRRSDVEKEHRTFTQALAKVLRISPQEMKERIAADKKTRKKRKPKKTSASGRASGGKD